MFLVPVRFALFVMFFILSSTVYAVNLSGVVSDEGEPVYMAEIILSNAKTKIVVGSRLTDKQGRFNFEVLEGVYNFIFSKNGYAMVKLSEVNVQGDEHTQNAELILAAFSADGDDGVDGVAAGLGDDSDGCSD